MGEGKHSQDSFIMRLMKAAFQDFEEQSAVTT